MTTTKRYHIVPSKNLLEHLLHAKKFKGTIDYNYSKHPAGYYSSVAQIVKHLNSPDFTIQAGWKTIKKPKMPWTKENEFKDKLVRTIFADHYDRLPPTETFTTIEATVSMGIKHISNTTNLLRKMEQMGLVECIGKRDQLNVGRKLLIFRRAANWKFQRVDIGYSIATKG